ncbi:PREDICTED: putative cleavage and polyadenylation specificity factor subunit 4-like protein [Charadrius vociferus]|uniref:putative cleavage and polyadenylation specificity factor subunit 4-like protein n=1 Tax=Charadrius vociferus TaxID=50402 RepID=UPI00052170F6|nr:PREDICTED: putative cleavage and polyadenylation specificity factor subunit 4-like protein [Charadrius vociferus]
MQELVAGVEKIRFDLEADVEQQRGAWPLPFPEPGVAVCEFFHRGLCTKGLCKKGDGRAFLHKYDVTKMPECYFYSKFGECSSKDCPFLHVDATASTMGCPWYDRGFCRHGPLCKYKHTQRVMCTNYLVGFCPEGPKCKFTHLKAGLMTSSMDPSKGAGCPRGLDLAVSGDSGCKDVPPMETTLPATGATQRLAAQLWDTSSCPPGPQGLLEPDICFKCGQKGHYARKCGKTQMEILLGK